MAETDDAGTLVQYIVVRKDLKWPVGALIAQACHASTAALWATKDDAATRIYMEHVDHMHKVVLAADSETDLDSLAASLTAARITHKRWIELPDNIVTCVASAPGRRDLLQPLFKMFKLMR